MVLKYLVGLIVADCLKKIAFILFKHNYLSENSHKYVTELFKLKSLMCAVSVSLEMAFSNCCWIFAPLFPEQGSLARLISAPVLNCIYKST